MSGSRESCSVWTCCLFISSGISSVRRRSANTCTRQSHSRIYCLSRDYGKCKVNMHCYGLSNTFQTIRAFNFLTPWLEVSPTKWQHSRKYLPRSAEMDSGTVTFKFCKKQKEFYTWDNSGLVFQIYRQQNKNKNTNSTDVNALCVTDR